jgi:integrase
MSFQDPKIETRGNVYRIRVRVPVVNFETGRVERVMKPIVLGRRSEMTLSEAKKKKVEVLATVNAGSIVTQAQLPFALLVERFEAVRIPALGARTREKYLAHIKNHIRPAFAHLRLCDIDRYTVEALLAAKSTLSAATRADIRNIISAIFEQAKVWRIWSGENPARGAELGRGGPVRPKRFISREEISRFLSAIPETEIVDLARAILIVKVAITTGFRVSEVLGLRYSDLDAKKREISVSRRVARGDVDEPKSAASRRVAPRPVLPVRSRASRATRAGRAPRELDLRAWREAPRRSGSPAVPMAPRRGRGRDLSSGLRAPYAPEARDYMETAGGRDRDRGDEVRRPHEPRHDDPLYPRGREAGAGGNGEDRGVDLSDRVQSLRYDH